MNVLLLTSHSIAEYDDLRMLTDLGYDVFSIGAYTDPLYPTDDKRPAFPQFGGPYAHNDFADLCDEVRRDMGDPGPRIDWAKAHIHDDILDWADAIIVHHFPEWWIVAQWDRLIGKRVIWRTCGQSSPDGSLERLMAPLRGEGLEIVRYSPRERFITDYAGEDALIRFGKYPSDYGPWEGDNAVVGNVTQNMAQRGESCGYSTWMRLTQGLPTMPAGPGSQALRGGIGGLTYDSMLRYLRSLRGYLYTGTHPASYTLGLMEAMLSGVPVVAPRWDVPAPLSKMYEAPDITPRKPTTDAIPEYFRALFDDREMARRHGEEGRQRAIELFDVANVGPQWKAFLG